MNTTADSRGAEGAPYTSAPGRFDEAVDGEGEVRPSWQYLLDSLAGLGPAELAERQQKVQRILRDDGATYNIYDTLQRDHTWPLDLVPWVIDSGEWSHIEAGLLERAELYNLVLRDLYGERELITRGILPPEVVVGHKGFLRPCHDIRLPGEHQLVIHAVDMMRRPDGSMVVVADRTQAPSGAGYALENRTVMSRVFPSLFRDSHVHRLANFFQNLRQKLMELAPDVASPRIVVLTPGAYNEAYFEHAYLANYLGFSLVQSGDLVVRDGYVWMKSLDGLTRVDVILRRIDDYFCDPVELKGDSQLGVAGLLQVVRAGRVAIANPLGSGILENPALLPYLPAISRHFLGRELRLPTVDTWWCGDTDQFQEVLARFDDLVIKPVFRALGAHSQVVAELDQQQRDELREQVRNRPDEFVAQARLVPSRTPVFDGRELTPRPAVLRSFAVASEASYRVMPGGLTRVGPDSDTAVISHQVGAVSKDTWVLASEPEKQVGLWPAQPTSQGAVEAGTLPSRVVENLFWLGRYAERAENGLRLMRTVFLQTNSSWALPVRARDILLRAVTRLTATYPGFVGAVESLARPEPELVAVILDRQRTGSIANCVESMLAAAEESRELLSTDTQRIINDIRDQMQQLEDSLQRSLMSAPEEALDPLVSSLLALSGIVQESMIRGMGWRFIDMGRRLERSLQTVNLSRALLGERLPEREEAVVLESLLMTTEALITFRRRYRANLDVHNVLELTLLDSSNPRSVLYQLETLQQHVGALPVPVRPGCELEGEQRCLLEAVNALRLSRLSELVQSGDSDMRGNLDQLFSRVGFLLGESSNLIGKKYFDHAQGPRQLVRQNWGMD